LFDLPFVRFSSPRGRQVLTEAKPKEEGGRGRRRRWRWDAPMRKFQDSVKALQADIDHANEL
jgi:hypothetical protein